MNKGVVLGVKCGGDPNGNGHDCNASVKSNGRVIAIQAERIDRIKKSGGWRRGTANHWEKNRESEEFVGCKPSVNYCMQALEISKDDIDLIIVDDLGDKESQNNEIRDFIGVNTKVERISHHLAHASSAFLCSPFREAAILVVDGGGGKKIDSQNGVMYERQSFYIGKDNIIEHLHTTWGTAENIWGLGGAYAVHQKILNLDAGKLMGLAPYGKGKLYKDIKIFKELSEIDILMDNRIIDDNNMEDPCITRENNIYRLMREWDENPVLPPWSEIAYKIQTELEECLIKICYELYKCTKMKNLCIAGGVGLNSVANQKILERTPFENIFIQPAADDSGIGLGCALYGYHAVLGNSRDYIMKNAYLGKEYTLDEIKNALRKNEYRIKYEECSNIAEFCASEIERGKIIAWYQEAAEYGPRALGNRSLICDPRYVDLRDRMNLKVKGREWWRPLAPSVLSEYKEDYFDIDCESPFMLQVARVKKDKAHLIPGVVHVDGTARIQTVSREENRLYWDLINNFYKLTGIPMILNTSFNLNNEPIVESPEDAINTYLKAKSIDFLIIKNYIIRKKEQLG